jgi:hypothetical protein
MDRAIGAGGLVGPIRTLFESLFRIAHEAFAIIAQACVSRVVVMVAIDPRHASEGILLAFQPARQRAHGLRIAV